MHKPIFIIGCPRSGTSLTLDIMARHEELAWVSNFVNINPLQLNKTRINRIYDMPLMGDLLYFAMTQGRYLRALPHPLRKKLPVPVEPWSFWNRYLENFQWKRGGPILPRRRTKQDISAQEAAQIQQTIAAVCTYQNKKRFLSKYTDFPRITYLSQAFPDALFVHIVRDGRAVAASYLEKIKDRSFGTWNEKDWWIQGWPEMWRDEWLQRYKTPLSFVAFHWKFFVQEIWEDAKAINEKQYMEVNYRDIIGNPLATFNHIFDFCGLRKSKRVASYIDRIQLNNRDYKWKEKFTDEEKEMLNTITGEGKFKELLHDADG